MNQILCPQPRFRRGDAEFGPAGLCQRQPVRSTGRCGIVITQTGRQGSDFLIFLNRKSGQTAEEKPVAEEAPVNPVEAGPAVAPKDETGKFDVTKIAEASDFTGVEEESGCKS